MRVYLRVYNGGYVRVYLRVCMSGYTSGCTMVGIHLPTMVGMHLSSFPVYIPPYNPGYTRHSTTIPVPVCTMKGVAQRGVTELWAQ